MHKNHFICFLFLSLALLVLLGGCEEEDSTDNDPQTTSPEPETPAMLVGFAQVDVTPIVPVKMAGYGTYFLSDRFCRWSTDVHDPLYAQGVAFEDNQSGRKVILIVVDIVGLMTKDIQTIQTGVANNLGLDEQNIVVASTHNHHGPDTIGLWGTMLPPKSGRQEDVVNQILHGAIRAGTDAWNARVPATLEFAVGMEAELHENIIEDDPYRTIDDTTTIMAAYDENSVMLGTVMNWACHPTVMGQESTSITSDFPGVYYRIMNENLGGIHLFLNGTLGAMVQPVNKWRDPDEWEEVEKVGIGLVEDAMDLLDNAQTINAPAISFLEHRLVPIQLKNVVFVLAGRVGLLNRELPPLGGYAYTSLTAFAIGPVIFGTLPGEFVPDYSFALREIMRGQAQMLIGLGMDWIGYILTPRQSADSAYLYERMLSPGPDTGEEFVEAYQSLWDEMSDAPSDEN